MFIRYIWTPNLTVQTKEWPIEVITNEVIEVYNEEWDEFRMRYPWLFVQEDHNTNPVGITAVPIDSTTALVNNQWNDATWVVWDASKPFLTIQAAINAVPALGKVRVEWGTYIENLTFPSNIELILNNASLIGDVSTFFWAIRSETFWSISWNITADIIALDKITFTWTILPWLVFGSTSASFSRCDLLQGASSPLMWDGTSVVSAIFNNCRDVSTPIWVPMFSVSPVSVWGANSITFNNCNNIQTQDTMVNAFADNTFITFNNSFIITRSGLLTWPCSSANNRITITNSVYNTIAWWVGYLVDVTAWLWSMEINSYRSKLKALAQPELLRWATNPVNAITLKSLSDLNVPWNIAGTIVNQTVNDDFIDINLP